MVCIRRGTQQSQPASPGARGSDSGRGGARATTAPRAASREEEGWGVGGRSKEEEQLSSSSHLLLLADSGGRSATRGRPAVGSDRQWRPDRQPVCGRRYPLQAYHPGLPRPARPHRAYDSPTGAGGEQLSLQIPSTTRAD